MERPAFGNGFDQLNNPNSAELLKNGTVLIADESNNRVIEVEQDNAERRGDVHGAGHDECPGLSPSRLQNGSNSGRRRRKQPGNHRRQERQHGVSSTPQIPRPAATQVRRRHGPSGRPGNDILISDQFNNRVILINKKQNLLVPVRQSQHDRLWHDEHATGLYCAL